MDQTSNDNKPFIKKLIDHVSPPTNWRFPVMIALGIFVGLGLYVLHISKATAYLSTRPEACMNCHVMAPQYATWQRSSHARVANCIDCHLPHDNLIRTYAFKASDGFRHSYMYTFRLEPQVIRIKEAGRNVVQENCIRCHSNLVHNTSITEVTGYSAAAGAGLLCIDCHRETPHGKVNSLASVPYARIPQLDPVIPRWMENFFAGRKEIKSE